MNSVIKSVLLSGNTRTNISYTCYPVNEFSRGRWQMCVNSLSYETEELLSLSCVVTCNFVMGQLRTKNGDIRIAEV